MIFRLSTKLAAKLKVAPRDVLPAEPDPFADWSGHVFTADRTQFVIVTNTASLYSTVFPGPGVSSDRPFIERALESLRAFMAEDGLSFIHQRFIAPAIGEPQLPEAQFPAATSRWGGGHRPLGHSQRNRRGGGEYGDW